MTIKLSVTMSDQAATTISDMARRARVSVTEKVGQALSTQVWLEGIHDSGSKVLVERADGSVREIHFAWEH
jgi:hypothetical protein